MAFNTAQPRQVEFEFRGQTGEWFGIWITNLLLTMVTLGIYSAWAKVRTKKYFYQNTYVAGRNFDYHATGWQIFVGRVIVIVGLLIFSIAAAIPIVGLVAVLGLLAVVPWLLVRALRFNAVVSSWSNVRFGFDGGVGQAFLVYLLYPFLTAFTLYLAWPFADRATRRFSVSNHRLGAARFHFDASIGAFYKALFAAGAWIAVMSMVIIAFFGQALARFLQNPDNPDASASVSFLLAFYAFIFIAVFPAGAIYQAYVRNTVFNSLTLDGTHRFRSDVRPLQLCWIILSNAIVTICTLGLLLPWAQIRLARYNAAHTALVPGGSLDTFVGQLETRTSALGDAYADIEGLDVGLAV